MNKLIQLLLLILSAYSMTTPCHAENTLSVTVFDDNEITVEHYPASGKYLVVWLVPEYGFREGHRSMATMLGQQGIEVWLCDITESLFLPRGSSSIKNLDSNYVADLIEHAHQSTGKKIVVAGDSYAALSALSGAHQWQQRKVKTPYLIGAILFSPYTYAYIPPLGQLPEYMPIISSTNIPLIVYQSKNSGIINQFDALLEKLRQHGNPVYTRMVPNIMSLFYEEEPTEEMIKQARLLPENISKMIAQLERHPLPENALPLTTASQIKRGLDTQLNPFKLSMAPVSIQLQNTDGNMFVKNDYQDQITVINFWATWCGPCVREIPSLNRLKDKMKHLPFELISINYAEDKKTIDEFMKKVNVNFPVLLDHDGTFSKQWNVIAFPSTFVIGPDGKIRYGINAAIEWDEPAYIEELKSLLE